MTPPELYDPPRYPSQLDAMGCGATLAIAGVALIVAAVTGVVVVGGMYGFFLLWMR